MLDLHLHSLISDGEYTPSEVVKKAKQNGVSVLSLTDHDSIGGIEEAEETCKKLGIQFIPGVELEASTDITRSRYIHILAYNFSNTKYWMTIFINLDKNGLTTLSNMLKHLTQLEYILPLKR